MSILKCHVSIDNIQFCIFSTRNFNRNASQGIDYYNRKHKEEV